METVSWGDVLSLENLQVDWDYEPENPLGQRSWVRLGNNNLSFLLNVKSITVKIVSRQFDETGSLIDISPTGLAVLLSDSTLTEGLLIKVSLFLGKQKVLSRAVVRNICSVEGKNRIGLEFVEPAKEDASFIAGLISSKAWNF